MNRIALTIFFLVVITSSSFGQTDFRKGFIITHDNDTIDGLVEYRINAQNYRSCIFKGEQEEREYYPTEIFGFGYYNDKFFSSQIVKGFFVEVLVLGEISLFKSQNKYHLKKDTTVYDLESFTEEFEIDGKVVKRENNRWRGIISYLISDCINNPNAVVSNLNLNEKSLTKLIVRYNKCKGIDFTEFKTSKPWIKFGYGAAVGISKSQLNLLKSSNPYYIVPRPRPDDLYLPKLSYSSINPSIGVLLNIDFPRASERLAFQSELHFSKVSYESSMNTRTYFYHDIYIDLSTLSIPLSLKYSFFERKYGLYIQGGVNFDYHLIAKSKNLTRFDKGWDNITFLEGVPYIISKEQIGFWGGLGIYRSIQKYEVGLAIRAFYIPGLRVERVSKSTYSNISIDLILLKK